jgi:hypothetical protein
VVAANKQVSAAAAMPAMYADHHTLLQVYQSRLLLDHLTSRLPTPQLPSTLSRAPHLTSLYAAPHLISSTAASAASRVQLAQSHVRMLLCLSVAAHFLVFALAPHTPCLSHRRPRQAIMLRITSAAAVKRFYVLERDSRRIAPWMAADVYGQIDADDAAAVAVSHGLDEQSRCACCLQ